jgi:ADP-ribose pyrophosphatase
MNFKETTLNKNYVYKGKIMNVRSDDVILPNGHTSKREIIEHGGGSCILCEKDGKILLVKQHRYAYGEDIWEIPAGKLNEGEDPMETARRELEEEGGIYAETLELLFTVYPTPGYSAEIIRVYRATNLKEVPMHLDPDEFLTGEWMEIDRIKKMIKSGEIKDGKTLIALLNYFANIVGND